MTSNPADAPADEDALELLVVDDDQRLRSLLTRFLEMHGFQVTAAGSPEEARSHLAQTSFDVLIVDALMPGESGPQFIESLRRTSNVPVLMLTAGSDIPVGVREAETGADDYLPKPFEPRELLLRITNILKRGLQPPAPPPEVIRFGPFTFHILRGELKRGDEPVSLNDRERDLLRVFARRPNATVSRDDLIRLSNGGGDRVVDILISRLQRKIEDDPANPALLQSTRGDGYRLIVG